MKLESVNQVYQ